MTDLSTDIAFEVVTLLPGFTELRKRSGELDGNLPVRAARYCGPVFEGSAAGFQIVLAQPMTLARGRNGQIDFNFTPPAFAQVTEEVGGAIERGVASGLLSRGGFWHRLLRKHAMPIRGQRVLVWTGHLIRPRSGIWPLVGGAFNRRSRIEVVDHLVSDQGRFVPLIVEIDARAIGRAPVWLEGEIGCVTPLVPAVTLSKERLSVTSPELRGFAEFFSEDYFETKARHPTACYVRRQRDNRVKTAPRCDARLLYTGPDFHTVHKFNRFITADGFSRTAASPGELSYATVGNIAQARWTWQGQTHTSFEVDKERPVARLTAFWRQAFGDAHPSALEFLSGYLMGEHWDQPYVQLQPWVFTATARGWSTLVDGVHGPTAYDGMRGVIATDWFHPLAMVYRIYAPGKTTIPTRAPLLRAIPIQRAVLKLGMAQSVLDA
jgi:hypothetical protein